MFVSEFKKEYGRRRPGLLRPANFYRERTRDVGGHPRGAQGRRRPEGGDALNNALQTNLTFVSVYGGTPAPSVHTPRPETHTVTKRDMGVFEFKGGKVTPKAFLALTASTTIG